MNQSNAKINIKPILKVTLPYACFT